jgi:hypothetical protein
VSPPLAVTTKAPSALLARVIKPEATRYNGWTAEREYMEQMPLFKTEIPKPENQGNKADQKTTRTLKIEEDGDSWYGTIKPKIRLRGNWLERAGFKPGTRVAVTCIAYGIIQLHSFGQASPQEGVV